MRLLRGLIVTVCLLLAPPCLAQQGDTGPAPRSSKKTRDTSVLPHLFAILSTLLVLFILCYPSRKSRGG